MSLRTEALAAGLSGDELQAIIAERVTVAVDPLVQTGANETALLVQREAIIELLRFVRDDERLRFDTLLELTAVDYFTFPDWVDERFAVVYVLKSTHLRHRLVLKVRVEEDEAEMPTATGLWRIADWLEREVWDQYGIRFLGHPNLKRLLNHHEFVGHPLRKDYPVQKRQHLSLNDPMVDELTQRLEERGYTILDDRLDGPQEVTA